MVDVRLLDADGCCPSCGDPVLADFEREYAAYQETYRPPVEREPVHEDAHDTGYSQACPRCGQGTDRLLGVTHRGGGTRYVCEDCRRDAFAADRSFWHWFHKE
jgi:hypothetical protein